MTRVNMVQETLDVPDPGTGSVTDPVMALWRNGAMTTAQTIQSGALEGDVVQLGLFESAQPDPVALVHPRHRCFAALLLRAPRDEDAALEVLALLEPELEGVARRLVRLGVASDVARGESLSVAWEVVAGHRVGPLLPTKACLVSAIWTELRRELGLRRRPGIEVITLTDEIDVAAPEVDPEEQPWPGLLEAAVAEGVLSAEQAVVVAQTRLEGRALAEVAMDLGRPYDAVQKDRRRAERALAAFARSSYDPEQSK
jgi:hypothetical protein